LPQYGRLHTVLQSISSRRTQNIQKKKEKKHREESHREVMSINEPEGDVMLLIEIEQLAKPEGKSNPKKSYNYYKRLKVRRSQNSDRLLVQNY
jgi:hypothetical protein